MLDVSFWPITIVYAFSITLLGTYFSRNLILAVQIQAFKNIEEQERENTENKNRLKEKEKRIKSLEEEVDQLNENIEKLRVQILESR